MEPPSTGGDAFPARDLSLDSGRRRRPARRTIGFGASLLVLVAAFAYHWLAFPANARVVPGWTVRGSDWLFGFAALLGWWYGVVPVVCDRERAQALWRRLRRDRAATLSAAYIAAFVLLGLLAPVLASDTSQLAHAYQPPVGFTVDTVVPPDCLGTVSDYRCHGTWQYPLGTNPFGTSVLDRTLLGMHVALKVVVIATALIVPLATAVGVVAGYVGGRPAAALMRYVDVQSSVPPFVVYLVGIYVFGRSLLLLVLAFGLLGWGGAAQVVRSDVAGMRDAGYVRAARGAGAGDLAVIRHHVLPNVSGTVLGAALGQVPLLILTETALAFMELNDTRVVSWGEVISRGMQQFFPMTWWISTVPVVCLAVTIVAFSVFTDAVRDALDPRTA